TILPPAAHAAKGHIHGAAALDASLEREQMVLSLELPLDAATGFERPPKTIPRNRGGHYGEWVAASIAGRPQDAQAGFWWSGPYMESLLVGTSRLNTSFSA
ncbi:MAG TPA: DUF2796 domain-containing protein, partial [Kiritimatiellia bacterium]|nr:DUF2796 domain-containing protein [Kiritimatiellia bacterium]